MKKFVITGGPGVGKTTAIEILRKRGYKVLEESARIIIEEEMINGTDIVPWKNLELFQERVVARQIELENKIIPSKKLDWIFADRGIIDSHGYSIEGKVRAPELIEKLGRGRYEKVFFLDRLPIHKKDDVRWEEDEHAERIHQAIHDAYIHFGYEPIIVPVLSPEERVDFILKHLF